MIKKAGFTYSYNFFSDSIKFKRKGKTTSFFSAKYKGYDQEIRLKNISLLETDVRKALIRKLFEPHVLSGFFEYEYSRYGNHRFNKEMYCFNFSIKKDHIKLIEQLLSSDREGLEMGYVILLQNILNGTIIDSHHLKLILDHQLFPSSEIPLDEGNSIYVLPYYSLMDKYSIVEYNRHQLSSNRDKVFSGLTSSDPNVAFTVSSFLCDERDLTYKEFLNDPVFVFPVSHDFNTIHSSQKWASSSGVKVDSEAFGSLKSDDILLIVDCFLKIEEAIDVTFNDGLKDSLKTRERYVGISELSDYLVNSENIQRDHMTLSESMLYNLRDYRYDKLRYYICYLLVNHSVDDANELIEVYRGMDDRRFFEYEHNLIAVMKFFEDERTMSLDMWLNLGSHMDEFADFLNYMY